MNYFLVITIFLFINLVQSQLDPSKCNCNYRYYSRSKTDLWHPYEDLSLSARIRDNLKRRGNQTDNFQYVTTLYYTYNQTAHPVRQGRQSLEYEKFCSGTLINPEYVLTSGYCIKEIDRFEMSDKLTYVSLGGNLNWLNQIADEAHHRRIERTILHPGFEVTENGNLNDIGLIQLINSFNLGKETNIFEACLSFQNLDYIKDTISAGYNLIRKSSLSDQSAQKMQLENEQNLLKADSSSVQFCDFIKYKNGFKCLKTDDFCSGDSGSPLLIYSATSFPSLSGIDYNKEHIYNFAVIALNSGDQNNRMNKIICSPDRIEFYTPIEQYHAWILKNIKSDTCTEPAVMNSDKDTIRHLETNWEVNWHYNIRLYLAIGCLVPIIIIVHLYTVTFYDRYHDRFNRLKSPFRQPEINRESV